MEVGEARERSVAREKHWRDDMLQRVVLLEQRGSGALQHLVELADDDQDHAARALRGAAHSVEVALVPLLQAQLAHKALACGALSGLHVLHNVRGERIRPRAQRAQLRCDLETLRVA